MLLASTAFILVSDKTKWGGLGICPSNKASFSFLPTSVMGLTYVVSLSYLPWVSWEWDQCIGLILLSVTGTTYCVDSVVPMLWIQSPDVRNDMVVQQLQIHDETVIILTPPTRISVFMYIPVRIHGEVLHGWCQWAACWQYTDDIRTWLTVLSILSWHLNSSKNSSNKLQWRKST